MRRRSLTVLVVATAVVAASSTMSGRQSASLSVQDAVALYARGEFAAAAQIRDTHTLKVAAFTGALDAWIAAGDPVSAPRRRVVAAAFALDAVWAATRRVWNRLFDNGLFYSDPRNRIPPVDAERERLVDFTAQPLVAHWAVRQLPTAGAPNDVERALWLTAVGIAEEGHAGHRLQNEILPLARKRLPAEPRLSLADVLARTNIELGSLRNSFRRIDVLRVESLGSNVTGRIPRAVKAFEPLLADSTLAGEVELRIGYLELRRKQWPAAQARFDAARSKATEPMLLAIADYFAGWVHEQQDHPGEAITAYRRALAITPLMRNLATRLSALLYLRNERAEAYAILDAALNAQPAPVDLLIALERADARFVPEWLESIRRALK